MEATSALKLVFDSILAIDRAAYCSNITANKALWNEGQEQSLFRQTQDSITF